MHPTTHINEVDASSHRVSNNKANNISLQSAPSANLASLKNGGTHDNNGFNHRENSNDKINGHLKSTSLQNGNGNGNGNGNVSSSSLDNSNGNGNTNGNINSNGGTISNSNGCTEGYKNDGRRDSTQVWTPLLANGGNNDGIVRVNGNGNANSDSIGNGNNNVKSNNGISADDDDGQTVLYGSPASNNNDWKDAEEMNNLKNGILHRHAQVQQRHHQLDPSQNNLHHHHLHHQHNNHHHQHNNHHPHHHHQQGNNNGSLINGKNGFGVVAEKYDEQDPLTGLYKENKNSRASDSEESDFDSGLSGTDERKQPSCGIFGCRPRWARRFASTHIFMVVFLLAYILQGMYMTYFVSVITTIEKLFQIKSRTTGLLLSASEMGQISTAMLLTYFAGRGHRPRWIACGMVIFSLAAFACSLPHFIFGKQLMLSNAAFNSQSDLPASGNRGTPPLAAMMMNGTQESVFGNFGINQHDSNLCLEGGNVSSQSTECNEDRKLEQDSHSKITVIVLCIFFGSLLSSGIGQTAVATLGIPYIDDNVASQKSAGYIAITIGVRILGPASGFIVGSICTRLYVNFSNPGYDASDPRWIGAWWLGPVMIGSLMMISSIAMFSFPKELRGKSSNVQPNSNENETTESNRTPDIEPEEKPRLRDFPKTVRRQLSNDILMFRTASCVCHLLPISGLYTFLPKYLETQYRLAPYDANMIAAFGGILVMGVGIVMSGLVILKIKPSARSVAAWIAFTALVYAAGMIVLMFVGCSMNDFAGYKSGDANSPAMIEPACSAATNCSCDKEYFAPICGQDGKIYISSCHAGCKDSELRRNDNRTIYSNCACIPDDPDQPEAYAAINGYCDSNCKNFILFILIFAVCVFMHSTSEVGSMLLVMRCTHPKDKAMAMGVIQSAIGLFGNVPCPIIYGAVVDSACLIWKTVCGKHGACSLYDADTFRHYFLGITAGIMFLAFIMDLVVWSKAHRIDIAPEESNEKNVETECNRTMSMPDTNV